MAEFLHQTGIYLDSSFWAFLVAITLLTMSPGVDTIVVIRNTLRGGTRDGVITSIAICLGLFIHAIISAGGISLILLQSAMLFTALKLVGAFYLIWLGYKSLSSAFSRTYDSSLTRAVTETVGPTGASSWRSFREGFLSNVLNPKTIVFYMAFLPQFIQAGEPAMLKSLFLAAVHFCIANLWQILIVLLVGKASSWLLKGSVMKGIDGLIGTVMVGFGLKLALDRG
ncbi:LysE family translocator [Oceanospirillum linum]|uniref:LysE family translocator n=1 Tax=Oceanospirillum linum TaxID=966 RepID=UPI00089F2DD6|nr:LysE family translocator [Oceanospirillum linum]SEG36063.1 Threonine/homoserine/homoserine lactone efflux protein [Oleiphilus messinensis]SMP30025.1 Threonine/homoserine/homoserine lactone efflux protein [Oceanospirillum linum]